MATGNNNTYEQVYNVQEDDSLAAKVSQVICLLVRRGVMVAGFNNARELLTIHYTGYNTNRPVWQLDFFEQLFASEPLLAPREKVRGVFVCSDRNLVVPNDLYDDQAAREWLRRIHLVEAGDVIDSYPLESDHAMYLQAIPVVITELIKINFKRANTYPLPLYQFRNTNKHSLFLQCCITGEQVCATLHNYSQLLWHKVFDYSCAEDIAYEIRLFCSENNIAPETVLPVCNTISAAEYSVLNDFSQYFPALKGGNGLSLHSRWDGAIYLSQQLMGCVS